MLICAILVCRNNATPHDKINIRFDTSSADMEIPNHIHNSNGADVFFTRQSNQPDINGTTYGTGNWTGFGTTASIALSSSSTAASNAPVIVISSQTSPEVVSDQNIQGRLGLAPAATALYVTSPPTVLDALVASGSINTTNVGIRTCYVDNSYNSFFEIGPSGLSSQCEAADPKIAWINSPVQSSFALNVRTISVGGVPVQLSPSFQANGAWPKIETCENYILLPTEAFAAFKNAIIANGGMPPGFSSYADDFFAGRNTSEGSSNAAQHNDEQCIHNYKHI
ncbi:hypothetical protein HK105_208864 [Polyrhizophydium stewartii]|uniref:Peptidase A1 domain-containing protein n=1 Tax=Polyrhizophydium stewartii TaxID=2732419 RepID=A0ABR4MWP9_9FUNG